MISATPSLSDTASNTLSDAQQNVAAIVVTYFTGPVLARSIASLKEQSEISEIIIVDNGNWSDAVTKAAVPEEEGTPVRILSGHGNIGFAAACNLGARAADADFLLFLNPDAVMPANGVADLLQAACDKQGPWMMGAKLVGPDGLEQTGGRRQTLTPWRAFVEAGKLYRLAPRHPYFRRFNLHNDPCPGEVSAVPVISGACILVPHQDYMLIDGMDENYFLHVEDIDFCLRFGKAGGEVIYNPLVEILHFKGSSRANKTAVEFHKTKGMQRYFRQHFSDVYPPMFLSLVSMLMWARFGMFAAVDSVRRSLSFMGLRSRRGRSGLTRARAYTARQAARDFPRQAGGK